MNNTIRVKSGSTLSYIDIAQGQPIIFIHGLFLDHTAFQEQIEAFCNRARIIEIDIHGQCEAVNGRNINAAPNIKDEGLQFLRLDVRL
jgi:pimeloyl-ACP methyl ester carboxylesterase